MRETGGPRRHRRKALAAPPPVPFEPIAVPQCPYCAEPLRSWPFSGVVQRCDQCSQPLLSTPSIWVTRGGEAHTAAGSVRMFVAITGAIAAAVGVSKTGSALVEPVLFFLASYGGLTLLRAALSLFSPLMLNAKPFRKTPLFRRMSRDAILGAFVVGFSLYGLTVV